MSSDYWHVPLGDLETIAGNLHSMSGELEGVESGAHGVLGTDDIHGHLISNAVEEFFHDWKASRKILIENIDKLGTVTEEITKVVREYDSELASSLNDFGSALREGGQ